MEPRYLTIEEVLFIHADEVAEYGGSAEVRDLALLESAVAQPYLTFDGQDLHSGLFEKAAAYLFHICSNHCFMD